MSNKIEDFPLDIKTYYFPEKKGVDYNKIMITTEGRYSISDKKGSSKLVELIERYFHSKDLIITDATGNNGSDTIALALKFKKVNSIELNETNYKALTNNVKVFNLNNVNTFHGDSLNVLPTLKQDVIYIDAPWGGTDYKNSERLTLFLGDSELSDVYNKFKNKTKLFVFKIPKNYDFTYFIQHTKNIKYHIYTYIRKDKIKYFLMFVPCNS